MGKPDIAVDKDAFAVGAPMRQRAVHASQQGRIERAPLGEGNSRESAHSVGAHPPVRPGQPQGGVQAHARLA